MLNARQSSRISELFKLVGDPFRIRLLSALANQEACVCHLVCLLGRRQAYISQHLMILRNAGILSTRRKGKYVFYSIKDAQTLALIERAGALLGLELDERGDKHRGQALAQCECPQCGDQKLITI